MWTNKDFKVLVGCAWLVACTIIMTKKEDVHHLALTGSPAEKRYMAREWTVLLCQAMQCVQKRKIGDTARVMERLEKRQCKTDGRQVEALCMSVAAVVYWTAHVLNQEDIK
jgi:hypothetical protein